MKYILTEKEYIDLIEKNSMTISVLKKYLEKLCMDIADNKPFHKDGSPYGCIRTKKYGHCGDCPVEYYCFYDNKYFCK